MKLEDGTLWHKTGKKAVCNEGGSHVWKIFYRCAEAGCEAMLNISHGVIMIDGVHNHTVVQDKKEVPSIKGIPPKKRFAEEFKSVLETLREIITDLHESDVQNSSKLKELIESNKPQQIEKAISDLKQLMIEELPQHIIASIKNECGFLTKDMCQQMLKEELSVVTSGIDDFREMLKNEFDNSQKSLKEELSLINGGMDNLGCVLKEELDNSQKLLKEQLSAINGNCVSKEEFDNFQKLLKEELSVISAGEMLKNEFDNFQKLIKEEHSLISGGIDNSLLRTSEGINNNANKIQELSNTLRQRQDGLFAFQCKNIPTMIQNSMHGITKEQHVKISEFEHKQEERDKTLATTFSFIHKSFEDINAILLHMHTQQEIAHSKVVKVEEQMNHIIKEMKILNESSIHDSNKTMRDLKYNVSMLQKQVLEMEARLSNLSQNNNRMVTNLFSLEDSNFQ